MSPALKWVEAEAEAELRAAFEHALAVRSQGARERDLADRYFFETRGEACPDRSDPFAV